MIRLKPLAGDRDSTGDQPSVGTLGHLGLFACTLGLIMLAPQAKILPAAAACLALGVALYPQALRRCLRPRWLALMAALALPPVFFLGEVDGTFLGLGYSSAGLLAGAQIALRMMVALLAVGGFTSAVDISAIAGLFERLGLHGLGFSLGVAMNLLPVMQDSAANAWRSLWMRGGLRRQRRRALRLLAVTVMTNALKRAEEIALAAEARAFSPERARGLPLQPGKLDRGILVAGPLIVLVFLLIV
jgi:energy-coupling factor transporter transmembrane protein EcfT